MELKELIHTIHGKAIFGPECPEADALHIYREGFQLERGGVKYRGKFGNRESPWVIEWEALNNNGKDADLVADYLAHSHIIQFVYFNQGESSIMEFNPKFLEFHCIVDGDTHNHLWAPLKEAQDLESTSGLGKGHCISIGKPLTEC